jgi:hypothetical protein
MADNIDELDDGYQFPEFQNREMSNLRTEDFPVPLAPITLEGQFKGQQVILG